jgi:hypothetical protein
MGKDPEQAWRGLLVSFLYFTPLGAGMVVWSAVVMLFNGRWAGASERWTLAGLTMAPMSLAAFIVLWLGRGHWATWRVAILPGQGPWLNEGFILARDWGGLIVLWATSLWYALRRGRRRPTALAGWLAVVYSVVMTVLAFDLVMSLDPRWYSTLLGGYFLVSGAYAGLAAWTIASILSGSADADQRHDLGKLLVAFGLITTYMMYSQLLPIWYENLGQEVRFVLPRLAEAPWKAVSAALLATVYLGPLVLLLPRRAKRSKAFLGAVAALVLIGLWVERWWLVAPTLGGPAEVGVPEWAIAAAFAGALGFGMDRFRWRVFLDDAPASVPSVEAT